MWLEQSEWGAWAAEGWGWRGNSGLDLEAGARLRMVVPCGEWEAEKSWAEMGAQEKVCSPAKPRSQGHLDPAEGTTVCLRNL